MYMCIYIYRYITYIAQVYVHIIHSLIHYNLLGFVMGYIDGY